MAKEIKNENDHSNMNSLGEKITQNQSVLLNTVIKLVEDLFQEASAGARFYPDEQTKCSFGHVVRMRNGKMHLFHRDQVRIAVGDTVEELFKQAWAAAQCTLDVTSAEGSQVLDGETEGKSEVRNVEKINAEKSTADEKCIFSPIPSLISYIPVAVSKPSLPASSSYQSDSGWLDENGPQMEEICIAMETDDAECDGVATLTEAVNADFRGTVSEMSHDNTQDSEDEDAHLIEVGQDESMSHNNGSKTLNNTLPGQVDAFNDARFQEINHSLPQEFSDDYSATSAMEDDGSLNLAFSVPEEPLSKIPKLDEQPFGNCNTHSLRNTIDSETEVNKPATRPSGDFSWCCGENPTCLDDKDWSSAYLPQNTEEFLVCSEIYNKCTKEKQASSSCNDASHEELISSQEKKRELGFDKSFEEKRDKGDAEMTDMEVVGQDVRQELQLIEENEENMNGLILTATSTVSPKHQDQTDHGCSSSAEKNYEEVGRIRLQENPVVIEKALKQDCQIREETQPIYDQMVPSLLEDGKSTTHDDRTCELYTDDDKGVCVKHNEVDIDNISTLSPAINLNEVREQQLIEEPSVIKRDVCTASENQLVPESSTAVFQWRHAINYQNQQPASSRPPFVTFDQQSTQVPDLEWRPSPLPPCTRKRRVGLSRRQRATQLHHASHRQCQQTRSSPNAEHEE